MNIADVVSGRAKLKGTRWVLLSATAHKVLADQLRALLPSGADVIERLPSKWTQTQSKSLLRLRLRVPSHP